MESSRPPRGAYIRTRFFLCTVSYLLPPSLSSFAFKSPKSLSHRPIFSSLNAAIVDADFVRANPDAEKSSDSLPEENETKSLFDLSLESDPYFLDSRIPFVDPSSGRSSSGDINYIDAKVAFMAELDGVQYGIAIPFDAAAALTLEKEDGTVQYLSPDLDDNEELMAIMADQLKQHVGEDLRLQRTPRVLTISGPLESYTANWKEKLLPAPVDAADLMGGVDGDDDSGDELAFFHQFMRDELGEKEYQNTLNHAPDDDDAMKELSKLFEVPGLGNQEGDAEGIEELLKSLLTPEMSFDEAREALGLNSLNNEGVALKLVSYIFAGGRTYSLVNLLKPYTLVGRYIPDDKDPRFELLTPAEERLVLPRLEEVCIQDLEAAGLRLIICK